MDINYLAVLVATVAAFAVGAVWHSPIGFGAYWMELMGLSRDDMHRMPLTPTQAMVLGFVATLVQAFVLEYFIALMDISSLEAGLQLGFWIWLGFLAPTLANSWLWEGRSLKLFAFNASHSLVSIEVMALVLVVWR